MNYRLAVIWEAAMRLPTKRKKRKRFFFFLNRKKGQGDK